MTGRELMKNIQRHPVVTATVPLQLELQWPQLTIENDKLCARFYFCRTQLSGEYMRVDFPGYVLKLSFPFRHVVLLEDLSYRKECQGEKPGWLSLTEENAAVMKNRAELLFQRLDDVLKQYETDGTVTQERLTSYHSLLMQMVPFEHKRLYAG
ncbi:hypothetical protein NXH76_09235 [Blautia schinkii]|nr:hypothetical protein [Blautia schinkii]